jgi:hypothetical protein
VTTDDAGPITVDRFGTDHWKLLLYVETRCVDYGGVLDHDHMRASSTANPEHVVYSATGTLMDGAKYPTRLANGETQENHDDWSCLTDLEEAGFLEIIYWTAGMVRMTPLGRQVAAALRAHVADTRTAGTFVWPAP